MTLRIYQLPAGPIETNAYLVVDTVTGEAMLVDTPPDVAAQAQHTAREAGANVRCIVITHGHWDHITGAADVVNIWKVPILAHSLVKDRLEKPENATSPVEMVPVKLDSTLDEGDEVIVGGHIFKVMHMPGHDEGHITLYSEVDGVMLGRAAYHDPYLLHRLHAAWTGSPLRALAHCRSASMRLTAA